MKRQGSISLSDVVAHGAHIFPNLIAMMYDEAPQPAADESIDDDY
ncbi:hypothetical protein BTHE68_71940 (plasmid) [Burkholderia sp. THE68]|nr:hypothetical protein [Burkholderia sp. THE68]BBU33460.1 hypothetical protein BTHE68_71940 [Burkholderia sp. THE68]